MRPRIVDLYDAFGYFMGYFSGHVAYYRKHGYTVLPARCFERVYASSRTPRVPISSHVHDNDGEVSDVPHEADCEDQEGEQEDQEEEQGEQGEQGEDGEDEEDEEDGTWFKETTRIRMQPHLNPHYATCVQAYDAVEVDVDDDDDDASKRERHDVHDDDESDRETVDLSICMPFRMGHFSATTACVHAVAHKLGMKL